MTIEAIQKGIKYTKKARYKELVMCKVNLFPWWYYEHEKEIVEIGGSCIKLDTLKSIKSMIKRIYKLEKLAWELIIKPAFRGTKIKLSQIYGQMIKWVVKVYQESGKKMFHRNIARKKFGKFKKILLTWFRDVSLLNRTTWVPTNGQLNRINFTKRYIHWFYIQINEMFNQLH